MKLGATGKFPQGKIDKTDEGELNIAVNIVDENVVIHFGKKVAWFGMLPEMAVKLAKSIIEHANIIILRSAL
jgi:hypothetical protein